MSKLKVSQHRGITCARATVALFGSRLNVYVYLVGGLLVDTGPTRFARQFISFFQSQLPEMVVLTHHHEDHSGNAPWLEKQGIPVYIHPSVLDTCAARAALPLYRRYFWGKRDGFSARPLPGELETGNARWQVLETPGHTGDHIALFNPASGAVFTGDLVVTPKTKLVLRTESVPRIMESLRMLLRHDFSTVYCGHAGPVEKGREFVRAKLEYLENLQGEVLELHSKGWTIRAINKKLFPGTAPLYFVSGGEWASIHLVRSIVEHHAGKNNSG